MAGQRRRKEKGGSLTVAKSHTRYKKKNQRLIIICPDKYSR